MDARTPTTDHDPVGTLAALVIAFGEGSAGVFRRPGQSLGVVVALAAGVAIALAISATGRAVETTVTRMLGAGPRPPDEIAQTLGEAQVVLTALAFAYTAALVAAVTALSLRSLRREIGVKRQYGVHAWEVVTELLVQAAILCLAGGVVGITFGRLLCALLNGYFSALMVQPDLRDAIVVFGEGVALGMTSILLVALLYAFRSTSEQGF